MPVVTLEPVVSLSPAPVGETPAPLVGAVVIGRNEAAGLRRSLRSVLGAAGHVVYVDSGSTDGSPAVARGLGVPVVELDTSAPFSAARARNAGLAHLDEHAPQLEYVQFVDGDCVMDPQWLTEAARVLRERPGAAIVCGRLRERNPDGSIFQALLDLEWDRPCGVIERCGGVFLARRGALSAVNGFTDELLAGEEPELCARLRGRDWQIVRVPLPMAVHDGRMTRFGQWWRRQVRFGRGAMQVDAHRRLDRGKPVYRRQRRSTLIWTIGWAVVLAALCLAAWMWPGGGLAMVALAVAAAPLLQAARLAWRTRRRGAGLRVATVHGLLTVLGKWGELAGLVQYWRDRLTRPPAPSKPAVAYLNSRYPAISHTFIEGEIQAVRRQEIEVHTFSVRRPAAHDQRGEANHRAACQTVYLLDGAVSIAGAACAGLLRPIALLRAACAAQRWSPPGITQRLKHVAYTIEAVRLARQMRRRRLRHLHVHMANNGAAIAMIACRFDRTLSYSLTVHGPADFYIIDSGRLGAKVEQAAWVRCISSFCKSQIMAWVSPQHWSKLHVVTCGVDLAGFPLTVNGRRRGQVRLLAVGRLAPVKGHALLLDACAALEQRGVDWRLTLVGDGPMRHTLEQRAAQLNMHGRVTFAGYVSPEGMSRYYAGCDLFVISSFMEGVPVVMMEAMASGKPVVATHVAGIPELIQPGVTGELVAPGSAEQLTDAIARAAARLESYDPSAARNAIASRHNVDDTGRSMAALLRRHTAAAAPARTAPR